LKNTALNDEVSAVFQQYADRGVFRGFRASPGPRGRVEYRLLWLLRRPMHAVFDSKRGVLTFAALFPGVQASSDMVTGFRALVAARTARGQPAHKRLDARRARVSCAIRHGDWSLFVRIRGANHEYAVRKALNLINELFLSLHDAYPDYLIERFGLSTE
jgi:hypothetical protein